MFLGSLITTLIGGGLSAAGSFLLVFLGAAGALVVAFTIGMLIIMLSQNWDTRPRKKKRSKRYKDNT